MSNWEKDRNSVVYNLPINNTGEDVCDNGINIRVHKNYNGSGSGCFNNFTEWPCVTLKCALPAGRDDISEELVRRLKVFILDFSQEFNLTHNQTKRTRENTREEVWEEHGL